MQMSENASPAPDCAPQNLWDSEPRHKDRLKSMGFDMENSLELSLCPRSCQQLPSYSFQWKSTGRSKTEYVHNRFLHYGKVSSVCTAAPMRHLY